MSFFLCWLLGLGELLSVGLGVPRVRRAARCRRCDARSGNLVNSLLENATTMILPKEIVAYLFHVIPVSYYAMFDGIF